MGRWLRTKLLSSLEGGWCRNKGKSGPELLEVRCFQVICMFNGALDTSQYSIFDL